MNLKETWKKVADFLRGPESTNSMMSSDVRYIEDKVRSQTGFDVICVDTRLVNVRRNVGLVMSPDTPAADVAKAEDIFIAAAHDRGIEIDRQHIPHYMPGEKSSHGRLAQPGPRTW